jgi:hypothetical protein
MNKMWVGLGFAGALFGCSARVVTIGYDAGGPAVGEDVPGMRADAPPVVVDVPRGRDVPAPPVDAPPPVSCARGRAADLLFVIDNSSSMVANQRMLARDIELLFAALGGRGVSLHVGVVSTDLGTPGSTVPSCANSDLGDDGLLNPVRNGLALRAHQPWTTDRDHVRPARCAANDPNQYPGFLTFDAGANPLELRDDFVCNAFLSNGGCGLEQQLESAYRALVVHNPRAQPGNRDPNAGFVRADAVLGILMLTDEDDGSVRDCRYAEQGVACTDGIGVYDSASAAWASGDLNLRFYLYSPGSAQDPTWNLDRYIDPARPNRGFTSLKPGAPGLVVFGAITGVPHRHPTRASGVDWDALLGRNPDGSDGLTAMSAEGPVSMRQRNLDPSCSSRVVPACRREGTTYDPMRPACNDMEQYFALPSRRVAQVVRRFDETYRNGLIGSICRNDFTPFMSAFARQIDARLCP